MSKFRCTNCNDEENILEIIVKDGVTHTFRLNEDLTLEHRDSDGCGQEIYLQCYECGTKYEFTHHHNMFALEIQKEFVLKRFGLRFSKYSNIEIEDLEFQKMED